MPEIPSGRHEWQAKRGSGIQIMKTEREEFDKVICDENMRVL